MAAARRHSRVGARLVRLSPRYAGRALRKARADDADGVRRPGARGARGARLVATIGAGWYCAARFFDRKHGERAVWGMASGYGNAANLGIPIAMQVLGTVSFLVEVLLLQTLIVGPVILATLDRHAAGGDRVSVRRIATLPLRNPVILGSALGIAASAAGFGAPSLVQTPLKLLSVIAVPAALIALGASLYRPETTHRTRAAPRSP